MRPSPHLDDLLRRYAQAPLPPVPSNLESRVWREIRARQTNLAEPGVAGDWLGRWLELWREPRVAFAGVIIVVAIGVGMSWTAGGDAHVGTARQALGLGVFSAEAPSLPSTLLISPVNLKE